MKEKKIGIHITHEAARKIGGIGAVLSGLCNSKNYKDFFSKTLFYGPLFEDYPVSKPQERFDKSGRVLVSTLDHYYDKEYNEETKLKKIYEITKTYDIDIVLGTKKIYDELDPQKIVEVDIILVGVQRMKKEIVDVFKFKLWEKYKFSSELYDDWDFEQYLRIAIPLYEIIDILYSNSKDIYYYCFAHEYMGMISCLSLINRINCKTFFYAHEVSTARAITENEEGHDLTFYSYLKSDTSGFDQNGEIKVSKTMEERFGDQKNNYRSQLIKLAKNLDEVISVGDWVKQEYCYLQPDIDYQKIRIVYNGIPILRIDYEKKISSREKLLKYSELLYNFQPDVLFTHVTRLVLSKGLWRDIKFLEYMDELFYENDLKGFYILLSSLIGSGRPKDDILMMEKQYGWPVKHKENWPDLVGYEVDVYNSIEIFNAKSKAIKGLFINQYGFEHGVTGYRLNKDIKFQDLRIASDVELGFSTYEPFGIAQIETIPFGGLAYLTRQCGCSFLLEKAFKKSNFKPYHIVDFSDKYTGRADVSKRDETEKIIFKENAKKMFELIPKNDSDRKRIIESNQKNMDNLSWDKVTEFFFRNKFCEKKTKKSEVIK